MIAWAWRSMARTISSCRMAPYALCRRHRRNRVVKVGTDDSLIELAGSGPLNQPEASRSICRDECHCGHVNGRWSRSRRTSRFRLLRAFGGDDAPAVNLLSLPTVITVDRPSDFRIVDCGNRHVPQVTDHAARRPFGCGGRFQTAESTSRRAASGRDPGLRRAIFGSG